MFEICLKLTIKTPEQRHWRCSGVFIVYFELILHDALGFILLTLSKQVKLMSKKVKHYETKEQVTIVKAKHGR